MRGALNAMMVVFEVVATFLVAARVHACSRLRIVSLGQNSSSSHLMRVRQSVPGPRAYFRQLLQTLICIESLDLVHIVEVVDLSNTLYH